MDYYGSDHRPIYINTSSTKKGPNISPWIPIPFMFEHKWILEEDYADIVKNSWNDSQSGGNPSSKLNMMAHKLKSWAKDGIGSLQTKIKKTRAQIYNLESSNAGLLQTKTIENLKANLEKLSYKEEIHW